MVLLVLASARARTHTRTHTHNPYMILRQHTLESEISFWMWKADKSNNLKLNKWTAVNLDTEMLDEDVAEEVCKTKYAMLYCF